VRGALKVRLHNPGSATIERCTSVLVARGGTQRRLQLNLLHTAGELVVIELEGVADRDAAEALRGARILVERSALEPLAEGEYLCADLLGCRVVDQDGVPLGTLQRIFPAGGADVLVVVDGPWERMIPFVDDWVTVDLAARTIVVRGAERWEPQRA
jgi:16S rRNA processing protein RimM